MTSLENAGLRRLALVGPAVFVVTTLLLIPCALLLDLSLHVRVPGRIAVLPGYTAATYARMFGDIYYLAVLWRTLWSSLLVTALTVLLGFPVAFYLWRAPPNRKMTLTLLVLAPLLVSIVVRSYAWMVLLGDDGVINSALLALGVIDEPLQLMYSTGAVIVGLVHVQLPLMVLSLLTTMERIDPQLLAAAETLAASRPRAIAEIVLPLSLPGLLVGAILVFTLSMTAFVTPQLLGASGARVMTTLIYGQFTSAFDWPLGGALAALLSLASLLGVAAMTVSMRRLPALRRMEVVGHGHRG